MGGRNFLFGQIHCGQNGTPSQQRRAEDLRNTGGWFELLRGVLRRYYAKGRFQSLQHISTIDIGPSSRIKLTFKLAFIILFSTKCI